jgi:hypothetical protein
MATKAELAKVESVSNFFVPIRVNSWLNFFLFSAFSAYSAVRGLWLDFFEKKLLLGKWHLTNQPKDG